MTPVKRITLRVITRDVYARVQEIREQEIPATAHEVGLFLRRVPFREQISAAMLKGEIVSIECKGTR